MCESFPFLSYSDRRIRDQISGLLLPDVQRELGAEEDLHSPLVTAYNFSRASRASLQLAPRA